MMQVALSAGGGAEALLLDMVRWAIGFVSQVELQTFPTSKNERPMK